MTVHATFMLPPENVMHVFESTAEKEATIVLELQTASLKICPEL
jgi:hypothetical protein